MKSMKRIYSEQNLEQTNRFLAEIIYSRKVTSATGETRPLSAEISRQEMLFVLDIMAHLNPCRSVLEIGCAYGISSIVLAHGLAKNGPDFTYTILDPNQSSGFANIGRDNIRKAGFTNFDLREVGSEVELPKLWAKGEKYDLIFQDGLKTMDHCLLEFHYLDRLLRVGGMLIYDDVDRFSMNRFIRYISLYPHWEIVASAGQRWQSRSATLLAVVKKVVHYLTAFIPSSVALEFISDSVLRLDESLGLDASMIALRKIAPDTREYSWNVKF